MTSNNTNEIQGKVKLRNRSFVVERPAASRYNLAEPIPGTDVNAHATQVADEGTLTELNPLDLPLGITHTSATTDQVEEADQTSSRPQTPILNGEAVTVAPDSSDGSDTALVDVTGEIESIRVAATPENGEDAPITMMTTSGSGLTQHPMTLYVIYEVEHGHGVTTSVINHSSEDGGDDDDDITVTAESSTTEIHLTGTHDVGNHRLSSVQPEVLELTVGRSVIITFSPYRKDAEDNSQEQPAVVEEDVEHPKFEFSKQLLIWMDHDKHHLEIDLFRPKELEHIYPIDVLSPLCLYRKLRTLKIVGMMRSYQSYLWLVVWLNPDLSELTLEMADDIDTANLSEMADAQDYAKSKPTMSQVIRGETEAAVSEKLSIVKLSLTNWAVNAAFFDFFNKTTLQEVELCRCKMPDDEDLEREKLCLSDAKVTIVD